MKYIIQPSNDIHDIESIVAVRLLDELGYTYVVSEESVRPDILDIQDYIPIGSIPYVEDHLRTYYGIPYSCPIEIPKFLRTPEILKRKYDIVKVKDLPQSGAFFLKSAQRLKTTQYIGLVEHARKLMAPDDWCVISDPISQELIESEFRIFVYKGKVQAIKKYTLTSYEPHVEDVMPIVELMNTHFPINTYSFDIGFIETPSDKPQMFLIEVHLVASLGTYGFEEPQLIDMYKITYDFLKSDTHKAILKDRKLIW